MTTFATAACAIPYPIALALPEAHKLVVRFWHCRTSPSVKKCADAARLLWGRHEIRPPRDHDSPHGDLQGLGLRANFAP